MNNYPINLEKDYVRFFVNTVKKSLQFAIVDRKLVFKNNLVIDKQKFTKSFLLLDSWSAKSLESELLKMDGKTLSKLDYTIIDKAINRKYFKNEKASDLIKSKIIKHIINVINKTDEVAEEIPAIQDVITSEELRDIIENNVDLSKKLSDDYRTKLKNLFEESITKGDSFNTIVNKLQAVIGFAESKAQIWAQDQHAKFFGEMNRVRQVQVGFTGFIWITMKDSRVRPAHQAFSDKYFDWKDGTGIEQMRFPGRDYRCRCYAKSSFGQTKEQEEKARIKTSAIKKAQEELLIKQEIEFDTFLSDLVNNAIIETPKSKKKK